MLSESLFISYAIQSGGLFLLSFLLLINFPKVNRFANFMLGVFCLSLCCAFLQLLIETQQNSRLADSLVPWLEISRWAIFPSFFMSVMLFIRPHLRITRHLVHFIPVLLFAFHSAMLWAEGQHIIERSIQFPDPVVWLIRNLVYLQAIGYWAASYYLLRKHNQTIRFYSSQIQDIDLSWLRSLLWSVLIMTVLKYASQHLYPQQAFTDILYLPLILYLAYHALSQTVIYPVPVSSVPDLMRDVQHDEYRDKERLTPQQTLFFREKLLEKMGTGRHYLNPSLNLQTLADTLGLSTHELSYVLNNGIQKNFYQFVNEYRIDEAKRLLADPSVKSPDILDVAVGSGFNSRTAFYTAFKKMVGVTPTQYARENHH